MGSNGWGILRSRRFGRNQVVMEEHDGHHEDQAHSADQSQFGVIGHVQDLHEKKCEEIGRSQLSDER